MFIIGLWEATFKCTCPHRNSTVAEGVWFCSGNESLTGWEYLFQELSTFDITDTAVYSVAHALNALVACEHRNGIYEDPLHFQPWQVREKHVHWVIQGMINNRTLILSYTRGSETALLGGCFMLAAGRHSARTLDEKSRVHNSCVTYVMSL
jgi:hypothetical protein